MNRKLNFLLLMLLTAMVVSAGNITEQQARNIATQFVNNGARKAPGKAAANLTLAKTAVSAQGDADYYVFNNSTADGGFVIVGGDDRTIPVWGYSDSGNFNAADVPADMAWWLSEYQRQLEFLREHPEAARKPKALSTSVAPILTSTWKQSAPYNEEIPSFRFSLGTYKPVVGCVALAMAQMMRAHAWPTTGEGSHSYVCQPSGATAKTLSADFGATTYQWSSMKDSYSSSASATAVATLCYHAGVAVDMQYNTADNGGSGAQIYDAMKALRNYFRYDKGLDLYLRDFYPIDTWEEMLRADLDAGNPIIYGGSTANMYGHCFVFDGYDTDGKFHINWGWGGDYNGYFVSSVLDSGRSNADFSYWQQAILGAKPDRDGTSTGSLRPLTGYCVDFEAKSTQVAVGSDVSLKIEGLTLLGEGSYDTYYCGVQILTEDETTRIGDNQYQADLSSCKVGETYAIDDAAAMTVPADIAEGVYHVYCIYSLDDTSGESTIRYERPSAKGKYIKMEVKSGVAYFSEGEVGPVVTTPAIAASPRSLTFGGAPGKTYTKTVTVSGQNLEGDITATLTGDNVYSIDKTTVTRDEAAAGTLITVTYAPTALGETQATLTLSSEGANDVTVNIAGTAQDETPVLMVDNEQLTFSATEGATDSKTFAVSGNFIENDVVITLDGDDAFSVNPATISAATLADGNATVTVTFAPLAAGDFNATVTVASEGAQSKTVALTGTAKAKPEAGAGTAADPYLNIARYATIGEVGTLPSGMSTIYNYTEYPDEDCAWLTISAWGAWQDDAAQNWLDITASYSYSTKWAANAANHMLGYNAYFPGASKVIDSNSTENFYVTNCSQVVAYGHNYSSMSTVKFNIYECTETGEGVMAATTPVQAIEGDTYAEFLLTSQELDPSKIYKVELVNVNSEVFEFGFRTSLSGGEVEETVTLAEMMTNGQDDTEYSVKDNLAVVEVAQSQSKAFVTDGNGNWIQVEAGDYYTDIAQMQSVESLKGVFTGKNFIPTLTLSEAPQAGESDLIVTIKEHSLTETFAPTVNEVIYVQGYYNAADNALRAFSGDNSVQGQSATINTSWIEAWTPQDGVRYRVMGVAQIKEPWSATTQAVRPMDYDFSFQNYVVYPLDVPVSTGIASITGNITGRVNVYNMQGQLIKRDVDAHDAATGLKQGIYLIGGKKVVVK